MFFQFFDELRSARVPVTLKEYLALMDALDKNVIDLASVRAGLENGGKKRFWRSLEELAGTEEYHELARQEFPKPAPVKQQESGVSRRNMLKLMAASAGLAGVTGCTKLPL